ncbi:hypothetical protein JOB18_007810 [Solea senegalensis]|uniref:Uncharacterized protein n=1 Tax=Solea senegalensis TaxID=28829 RepID=A0AAV6RUG2_SOLSE|nr:hypothetical protein JOB18_007810 [Solea senegalensis]
MQNSNHDVSVIEHYAKTIDLKSELKKVTGSSSLTVNGKSQTRRHRGNFGSLHNSSFHNLGAATAKAPPPQCFNLELGTERIDFSADLSVREYGCKRSPRSLLLIQNSETQEPAGVDIFADRCSCSAWKNFPGSILGYDKVKSSFCEKAASFQLFCDGRRHAVGFLFILLYKAAGVTDNSSNTGIMKLKEAETRQMSFPFIPGYVRLFVCLIHCVTRILVDFTLEADDGVFF